MVQPVKGMIKHLVRKGMEAPSIPEIIGD